MYYPYLRSKQNEMLALREIAQSTTIRYSHIMPIIEPVRDLLTLDKTVEALEKADIPYAVVINAQGNKVEDVYAWLAKDGYHNYFPAFICDSASSLVYDQLNSMDLHDVVLVFKNDIDSDNEGLLPLLMHSSVGTIVGRMSRSLKKRLSHANKRLVTFKPDAFHSQNSNAQYANALDELYTEEHSFYKEENFDGFSDFCVLPKELQEGGMTPTTLAIHLTYKKNEDEIWVRHFLSDNQFGRENIQHKFKEAAIHVQEFYANRPKTAAVEKLLECLSEEHYPGLGKLKEYSVWNHLELINDFLANN